MTEVPKEVSLSEKQSLNVPRSNISAGRKAGEDRKVRMWVPLATQLGQWVPLATQLGGFVKAALTVARVHGAVSRDYHV